MSSNSSIIYFRDFLIESTVTELDKNNLREVIKHLISGDQSFFDLHGIDVKDSGHHWMLNYNIASTHNEYNRLTRGLIVQKPTGPIADPMQLIKSFPFIRFFNKHEIQADPVDLTNAEMIEKLDGTMVGIYFPTKNPSDPHWHTRKMSSSDEKDMSAKISAFHGGTYEFLPLIGSYVKKIPFTKQDVDYTFVFEFIHDVSMVVTKYRAEQHGLYLIGARNLVSLKEMNETELDQTAKKLGVNRPRRWDSIANESSIRAMMKQIAQETQGFEGFVFRDKDTGNRVKVKDEDYVKLHHMIDGMKFKSLIQKVLEGEEGEILAYFSHAKPKIEEIKKALEKFTNHIIEKIKYWQRQNLDRPALAHRMIDQKEEPNPVFRGYIFRLFNVKDEKKLKKEINHSIRTIALGNGKQEGSPKKLLDMLKPYIENDEIDA